MPECVPPLFLCWLLIECLAIVWLKEKKPEKFEREKNQFVPSKVDEALLTSDLIITNSCSCCSHLFDGSAVQSDSGRRAWIPSCEVPHVQLREERATSKKPRGASRGQIRRLYTSDHRCRWKESGKEGMAHVVQGKTFVPKLGTISPTQGAILTSMLVRIKIKWKCGSHLSNNLYRYWQRTAG